MCQHSEEREGATETGSMAAGHQPRPPGPSGRRLLDRRMRARSPRVTGWFGEEFDALGCDHPEVERAAQIFWRGVGLRVMLSTIRKLLREGMGSTAAIHLLGDGSKALLEFGDFIII